MDADAPTPKESKAGEDLAIIGPCPNCGDPTPGNYCPNCGQRRIERRVTLRRMLAEVVEDQLALNAALPRTVSALLFHPGRLSREYVAGRIQRYIPPFRLYLVCSVIFFLLLSFLARTNQFTSVRIGDGTLETARADTSAAAASADTGAAAVRADTLMPRALRPDSATGYLWGSDIVVDLPWPAVDRALEARLDTFRRMPLEQAIRTFLMELLARAPTAMFLILPLFALLLKLLYIRRNRYYVEHFVFGLHTHAFAFLMFSIMLLVPWNVVNVLAFVWIPIYLYVAMLRFYQQGWFRTLVKYGIVMWTYSTLLGLATFALAVVTLVWE